MADPHHAEAYRRRQAAAQKFQPKRVRLLLVAEAPPEDLERYFYFEDAGSRDPLFDSVCYVLFEDEEPAGDKAPSLKALRRRGVFVIELKPDAPIGDASHTELAKWLPMRVEMVSPEHIVCIGRGVFAAASPELERAGLPVVPLAVPFAGDAARADFAREFRHALVKAGLESLIRPLAKA